MAFSVFWNRRSGYERRMYDEHPDSDHRRAERRDPGSDEYVLILGQKGLDGFTLLVTIPVVCLILAAIVSGVLLAG